MKTTALLVATALLGATAAYAADTPPDVLKAKGCLNCHAVDTKKVGPAFKDVAAKYKDNQNAVGDLSAKLKSGKSFPAMPVAQDDRVVQVYDLSKSPPELRKIERPEITMVSHDGSWKHMARKDAYTNEQLADIVAYIRYAASGSRKPVDPSEVQ